jgi:hypothetical protein
MKKTALASILLILGISLFCTPAGAYPVNVGDYIYITSSGPLGGGGEIEVVNKANGFVFQSFFAWSGTRSFCRARTIPTSSMISPVLQ